MRLAYAIGNMQVASLSQLPHSAYLAYSLYGTTILQGYVYFETRKKGTGQKLFVRSTRGRLTDTYHKSRHLGSFNAVSRFNHLQT